jgi:hypothetical protein
VVTGNTNRSQGLTSTNPSTTAEGGLWQDCVDGSNVDVSDVEETSVFGSANTIFEHLGGASAGDAPHVIQSDSAKEAMESRRRPSVVHGRNTELDAESEGRLHLGRRVSESVDIDGKRGHSIGVKEDIRYLVPGRSLLLVCWGNTRVATDCLGMLRNHSPWRHDVGGLDLWTQGRVCGVLRLDR